MPRINAPKIKTAFPITLFPHSKWKVHLAQLRHSLVKSSGTSLSHKAYIHTLVSLEWKKNLNWLPKYHPSTINLAMNALHATAQSIVTRHFWRERTKRIRNFVVYICISQIVLKMIRHRRDTFIWKLRNKVTCLLCSLPSGGGCGLRYSIRHLIIALIF